MWMLNVRSYALVRIVQNRALNAAGMWLLLRLIQAAKWPQIVRQTLRRHDVPPNGQPRLNTNKSYLHIKCNSSRNAKGLSVCNADVLFLAPEWLRR